MSDDTALRKWLYLIIDHPKKPELEGKLEITDKRKTTTAAKNEQGVCQKRNTETGEEWEYTLVGLGYEDFDDEEDYKDRAEEAINTKLDEIDDRHLEDAGLVSDEEDE